MKNAVLWYVLARLVVVIASFGSLPLFSRLLSPSQFGDYALFLSCVSLLTPVFGLAMHASISRASFEFKGLIDEYYKNVLFASLICIIFFSSLVLTFDLLEVVNFSHPLALLIVFTVSSKVVTSCSLEFFRFKDKFRIAAVMTMLLPLLAILISYIFLTSSFQIDAGVKRIVGMSIAELIIALLCLFFAVSKKFTFEINYILFAFRYSLPLVVGSTSIVLVAQLDKFVISKFLGQFELGLYAFYATLASMVYIFSGAINQAIMPWVYKEFDMKEYAGVRLLYSRLLVLLCIVCLILISISDELLMLMGPTEYREYREVLQVLIFANFIQVCVMVEMVVLYFEKRTSWISIIMLASAGFIFLFNYLFLYDNGIEFSAWVLTVVNLLSLLILIYINIKALGKRLVHFRLYMLLILSISILLSLFYVFPMLSFFRFIFTLFFGFLGLFLFLYYVRSNDINFSLNRASR